jgi:O-antigen ligase
MGSHRRASSCVIKKTARLEAALAAAGVLAVVWGALAFGAVYRWASTPLAIVCGATGLIALVVVRRGPRIAGLALGLAAIGLAIALQLVPLPASLLDQVSPHADAFPGPSNFVAAPARSSGPQRGEGAARALSVLPDKTALALAFFACFSLFFFGMTRLLSAVGASAVVRSLVAFGVVLALIGIVQYVLLGGLTVKIYGVWQPKGYLPLSFGPFVNRNHFAGWMIMTLPLALAGASAAWEAGRNLTSGALHDRISWVSSRSAAGVQLMSFAAAVMGLSLLMSQSRSGMAGFGAATVMFAWVAIRHQATARTKVATAAAFGLILILVGAWAGFDRIGERMATVRNDAATGGGRRQVWSDTLRVVRDFPIAGTGLDTFGTAMLLYQTDRDLHFQEAHNDYLQLAAEGGLLVGIPVLVAAAIFIRDVRRRFREAPKRGTTYWLRVGAVIGLVSIALQSLVEFSLQMPGNATLFALLAAIAVHESPNLNRARSVLSRSTAASSRSAVLSR